MVLSLFPKELNKQWFKALSLIYTIHILPIPCTKLWGSKYIPWSKRSCWGFCIMQLEKVATILCHLQTMEMWVLAWIMDTRLVPLMHPGVWGISSLGLVSTKDLFILLGLLFVWSRLCTVDGGDFQVDRGKT